LYIDLHVSTRYACQILMKLEYLERLEKSSQISIRFMNIRPVESEVFYTGGQTDRRDETNSRFSHCCKNT